ncbi:MAG: MFS transporter, partial [Prevotella sp.]|nr:MFS transporter [Prevotella sp.]
MKQDRLWNANYLKVMATNFTMSFAFFLLTPLLPLYLSENFGASKDMIGLVLSGYTITALLIRPFSGFLVDSFPRKKVLLISLFLYFLLFGGYLLAGTLVLFAIVRTMHGGPFGASTVANSTVAIDVLPSSRRNEGIGFYGLSNNLATAIAPTIGVFIYKYVHDFDLLFWIAFIVAGVGFFVDSTIKMPQKQVMKDKKALSLDRFFLLKGWMLGVNMIFFGICYGVLSNYL